MTTCGSFVHLNLRMPASVFMDYVPIGARMWPSDLTKRANAVNAGRGPDFLGELWSLQGDINSILDASAKRGLKLFRDDANEAFKSGQREMRHEKRPEFARMDFLRSAVLFACAGERGIQLIRSLSETAASYRAKPGRPAAAAVIFEHLFHISHRPNDAASAAASWLDSARRDLDENTLHFRIERGLLMAEQGEADEVRAELFSISASLP